MRIFQNRSKRASRIVKIEQFQSKRALDIAKIAGSEISLWIELSKPYEYGPEFELIIRVKNEGKEPVSNLSLTCESNSGVKVLKKSEIFGTSSSGSAIKKLIPKQTISFISGVLVKDMTQNNFLTLGVKKASKTSSEEQLQVSINFASNSLELSA